MLNKNLKFKILVSLILLLSLFSLYTNNYFLIWMLMEVVTFTMIYILNEMSEKINSLYYYLITVIFSIILYFSMIMKSVIKIDGLENMQNNMILFALTLKLGLMPLHYWFKTISKKTNWMNLFILSTILKIQPLCLVFLMLELNNLIITILIINLIIASFIILNTESMKLVMAYSSMIHSSLMFFMALINMKLLFTYMIIYYLMSFMLFLLMDKYKINKKMDLYNLYINKEYKFLFVLVLILYSSLPPMLSFLMKWLVLESIMVKNNSFLIIMFIMVVSSTLMVWNYLNLFFNNFFMYSNIKSYSYKIMKNLKIKKSLLILLFIFIIMFMLYLYIDVLNF